MALIKCPECGKEVSEKTITCPNCGVRVGNGHSQKANKIVIVCLLIFAALCGFAAYYITLHPEIINGTSNDVEITQSTSSSKIVQDNKQPIFGIGESAEYKNIQVTLLGVTESNGNDFYKPEDGNIFVYPEFEIINNSSEDLTISSLVAFDAYQDDYSTSISFNAEVIKSGESLDGTIAPGKKLKGSIGYELPADYKELEINVLLDIWSDERIVFVYKK